MGVLRPERDPVAVRRELGGEGHRRGRAAAVQQGPRRAGRRRLGEHRQDRRDADAAGHEDVAPVRARAGSGCAARRPRRGARAAARRGRTPSRRGRRPRAARRAGSGTGPQGRRTVSTAATARRAAAGRGARPAPTAAARAPSGSTSSTESTPADSWVMERTSSDMRTMVGADAPARDACPAEQDAMFLTHGTAVLVRERGRPQADAHAVRPRPGARHRRCGAAQRRELRGTLDLDLAASRRRLADDERLAGDAAPRDHRA